MENCRAFVCFLTCVIGGVLKLLPCFAHNERKLFVGGCLVRGGGASVFY